MNILKHSLLELTRRRVKSIIVFLVFLLNLSAVFGSQVVLSSADAAKDNLLRSIGATVTLDYGSNYDRTVFPNIFTKELIDLICTVDHVIGYNQHYSDYVLPINFNNCRIFDGEDPAHQAVKIPVDTETSRYVVLDGNINLRLVDLFRNGHASLAQGQWPSEDTQGILVSEQLAQDNGLFVGDTVSFLVDGIALQSCIVGIYKTSEKFTVTKENIVGEAIFAYSPYNRIYADINTAENLFQINKSSLYVDFYVDSPDNIQSVGDTIKSMNIDWEKYSLVNTTQTELNIDGTQINSTYSLANLLLCFISIISVFAIVLVSSIWVERSRYESGIYLAIGAPRWYALLQQFETMLFTGIPAFLLSALTAPFLASQIIRLKEEVAIKSSGLHTQFITGVETVTSVSVIPPDTGDYFFWFLCLLGTTIVACILPSCYIMMLKPREILSRRR